MPEMGPLHIAKLVALVLAAITIFVLFILMADAVFDKLWFWILSAFVALFLGAGALLHHYETQGEKKE